MAKQKPLSFTTTLRNPMRIAGFLSCLLPFEHQVLTNKRVLDVIRSLIGKRLYRPSYVNRSALKDVFDNEDVLLTTKQLDKIILNSPQKHKETGFDYGWESRFDTFYKFPFELGLVRYAMGEQIVLSATGHMLVDAYSEVPINEEKIQNVLLNAMVKFRTNNPFRKNANSNVPLVLLLQVLKMLHDNDTKSKGIFRQELSLFICWENDDAHALYKFILKIRTKKKFTYSNEYMYDICLKLLRGEDKQNYFKMDKICNEAVDEYIRKMRSTGVISLRGNGRFLDFNTFEMTKIDYILGNYATQPIYTEKADYYAYMGKIDTQLISVSTPSIDVNDVRKRKLYEYAKSYTAVKIFNELHCVCHKRTSVDLVFRVIAEPVRLEFLTSIALVQQFKGLDVNPNYSIDDEGLPTCTAGGGVADIVCFDPEYDGLFEVTLMCGRNDQVNNEIVPIQRHLTEARRKNINTFAVFIAPKIHADTRDVVWIYKEQKKLDILAYDIDEFIKAVSAKSRIGELLNTANT